MFRDRIIDLIADMVDENTSSKTIYAKYLGALEDLRTYPSKTTSGECAQTKILEALKWVLEYGNLEQVCMDEDHKYSWYPFIVDYNWNGNVVIYAVNFITRKIGKRVVQRETDYTPYELLPPRILKILPQDAFILPTYNYVPHMDFPLYDADNNIEIYADETKYSLVFNENSYIYDRVLNALSKNGKIVECDDQDEWSDFEAVLIGAGYKVGISRVGCNGIEYTYNAYTDKIYVEDYNSDAGPQLVLNDEEIRVKLRAFGIDC